MPTLDKMFPINHWNPSISRFNNDSLISVEGVLPRHEGFRPHNALLPNSDAISGKPLSMYIAYNNRKEPINLVATTTGIYASKNDGSWDELLGDTQHNFTAHPVQSWEFSHIHNFVIAVSPQVLGVFKFNINSDKDVSDNFVESFTLINGSPAGKYTTIYKNHLFLADIVSHPTRVHWSGFENIDTWEPNRLTLAGFNDLPEHNGVIHGIVSGLNTAIFQEKAITIMSPSDNDLYDFEFDELGVNVGTISPDSIVIYSNHVYFYSNGGFYRLNVYDGEIIPIGHHELNTWIKENITETTTIRGLINPRFTEVWWSIKSRNSINFDTILIYNWELDRWGLITTTHILSGIQISDRFTTDNIDSFFGVQGLDNPDFQVSLDSPRWQSYNNIISLFDMDNRRGVLDGLAQPSTFVTGFLDITGRPVNLEKAKIIIDPYETPCNLEIEYIDDLAEPVINKTGIIQADSFYDYTIDIEARYFKFNIVTQAGYDSITHLKLYYDKTGRV